jgi:flagellin-like hook-associated protein FlgL
MNPQLVQAKVVAHALRLYVRTGLQANRAYTPAAMLMVANRITGQQFKRGQYTQAAQALSDWAEAQLPAPTTA